MGMSLCPQEVRDRVDAELTAFFDTSTRAMEPEVVDLLDPVRAMLTRGKHANTGFCYRAYRAAGGAAASDVWPTVCAALELGHVAMLTHDDVIDRSVMRRGRDAVHRAYADHHVASGWSGDPDRYGMETALCIGDLLVVESQALMDTATSDPAQAMALRRVMHRLYREAVYGETLELRIQRDRRYALDRCAKVAHIKTGRWLANASACGAIAAGADRETVTVLDQFGELMGFAYQMRDDLLGVFGDPAVTGKPAIDDLRDGKPTALIALAITRADAAGAGTIAQLYGNPELTEADGDVLRTAIRESGAVEDVEDMIVAHLGKVVDLLSGHDTGRSDLLALAHSALNRSS
jgi:geranylgeranyl diphosphate synthase, type I